MKVTPYDQPPVNTKVLCIPGIFSLRKWELFFSSVFGGYCWPRPPEVQSVDLQPNKSQKKVFCVLVWHWHGSLDVFWITKLFFGRSKIWFGLCRSWWCVSVYIFQNMCLIFILLQPQHLLVVGKLKKDVFGGHFRKRRWVHDNVGKVSLVTVVQYCFTNADNPVTFNFW